MMMIYGGLDMGLDPRPPSLHVDLADFFMAHLAAGSLYLLEPSGRARVGSGVTTSVSALGIGSCGFGDNSVSVMDVFWLP